MPVQGAVGTVYEGLTFRLTLKFTSEYPFKPPAVRFETGCFHPNVDANGHICLDILKDKWSGAARRACPAGWVQQRLARREAAGGPCSCRAPDPGCCASAAAYSVKSVLQSIQSLLADPNVDSPLNVHAAKLWGDNMTEYKAMVDGTYAQSKPRKADQ